MDKVEYWKDIASYDMETAEAMNATHRWLYVGFMCHQVIEKMLKAYWCKTKSEDPPYVHNLIRLAEDCGIIELMTDSQKMFMAKMLPLNIEARYPDYKESLLKSLSPAVCGEMIAETKEMKSWIETML